MKLREGNSRWGEPYCLPTLLQAVVQEEETQAKFRGLAELQSQR